MYGEFTNLSECLSAPSKVIVWGEGSYTADILKSIPLQRLVNYLSRPAAESSLVQGSQVEYQIFPLRPFEYDPLHPYITDALGRFGDNFFDLAIICGDVYRADCLETASLAVKKNGLIFVCETPPPFLAEQANPLSGRRLGGLLEKFPIRIYSEATKSWKLTNGLALSDAFATLQAVEAQICASMLKKNIRYALLYRHNNTEFGWTRLKLLVHPNDFAIVQSLLTKFLPEKNAEDGTGITQLYGSNLSVRYFNKVCKLECTAVQSLFFTSPNQGERVALCPDLQCLALERRLPTLPTPWFALSPHDAFIYHICCLLFEPAGTTRLLHEATLEALINDVNKKALTEELKMALFAFAATAVEIVSNGDIKNLAARYNSFIGY